MAESLKKRDQIEEKFKWDLSKLNKNDEEWEESLAESVSEIRKAEAFKGTLNTAENIRKYYDFSTAFERKFMNVYAYAELRCAENTADPKAQEMYGKVMGAYALLLQSCAFATPEILSLDEAVLEEIAKSKELEPFAFVMQKMIDQKQHVLTAEAEELLAAFAEAFSAPQQIASNLQNADMKFHKALDSKGEEHQVTQSNYILLQESEDRTLRKNAFRSFYKGFENHINTYAAAYNGCVKGAEASAKVRKYESSRAMAMDDEHIPLEVYDGLIAAVRKYMPAMHRYVSLRKKMMGLDELHYYDIYTPLVGGSSKSYTYDEAKEMVKAAVAPLGEDYVKRVQDAYDERWIDVYPNEGKRGGAFSAGTYDSNPYILLNFTGTLDSVSTMAHEMGHSQHTWLANHTQEPQNADYTLFVAEVASTCNENLLVEQLLEKTEDPREKMILINQYLEGFKGTVYRQTMFAEFEKEAHAMAERGEALTATTLSDLYIGLIKDYFGPELVIDDEVKYEWARIPHFYRPFYVFKYATSYSAAVALSEAILKEGEPAAKRYLEFLSMGGSAYPVDELKCAGVDFTTPLPVEKALEKFDRILDLAEEVLKEL